MARKSQLLKRDQVLSNCIDTRKKLRDEISQLTNSQHEIVFLGIWSIKDLMAHVIGWDYANYAAAKSIRKGQLPAFYKYRDHDWQTYNAMLVKKYKKDSVQELLADMDASHAKLLDQVEKIPVEDFNKDFGVRFRGYKVTIQRLIEADSKDVQIHFEQIVGFFKAQDDRA